MTGGASTPDAHVTRVREIAEQYTQRGYQVFLAPSPTSLPIDLGGYDPDLVAEKDDEHLVIEVRTHGAATNVDRYREIAENVATNPGWRFLLVTEQDIRDRGTVGGRDDLPSITVLRNRIDRAHQLRSEGDLEAAYLLAWSALEGTLRMLASQASVPVERMPVAPLAKHLYTQGEISATDLNETLATLDTRNRLVHGFVSSSVAPDATRLENLVERLYSEHLDSNIGFT